MVNLSCYACMLKLCGVLQIVSSSSTDVESCTQLHQLPTVLADTRYTHVFHQHHLRGATKCRIFSLNYVIIAGISVATWN